MLKFIKPHSKVVSPERLQKQKELFSYNESCFHGFPSKPSALAWDPKLRLLALATKNGHLRIYGAEGIEFYGYQDSSEATITKLCFLPGKEMIISLSDDNSLHLWKIQQEKDEGGRGTLVATKSTSLEGKLKKISAIIEDADSKNLLVGTEGGNIYVLDLEGFTMTSDIIYQDVVMQNVPEDYKVNPGAVEVICPHPTEASKILIGYQRGLIVLWDRKQLCAEQTYVSSQQLECLSWNYNATEFISSHNDGSYITWSVTDAAQSKDGPCTVYGPFPCKPINKIVWTHSKEGFKIFSGGMPRASYGDRHTVTVMQGEDHVTFNLSSRIVDFQIAAEEEAGNASLLIILTDEEIVFIDLITEGWPSFQNPYLCSLHSSAITCCQYISKVDSEIFDKIKAAGEKQMGHYSRRSWPINGGNVVKTSPTGRDILLTGHEDGTVRYWDASGVCLKLLYKLSTASVFVSDDVGEGANAEDEDWPPFRKAGLFDPYSDDPRLGVKKMQMCSFTGILLVAGTAGQIMVYEVATDDKKIATPSVDINLVAGNENFVWKSHSKLEMHKDPVLFGPGLQPLVVMQFYPPASCTSLNLHSEWGLVAAGTAHGFALFDYIVKKSLLAKSTLSPMDLAIAADEGPMSRRKSLKKSLRESFRRLRKGRSQRKGTKSKESKQTIIKSSPPKSLEEDADDKVEGRDIGEGDSTEAKPTTSESENADSLSDVESLKSGSDENVSVLPIDEIKDVCEFKDKDDTERETSGFVEGTSEILAKDADESLDDKVLIETQDETIKEVPFFYYITPKGLKSVKLRKRGSKESFEEVFVDASDVNMEEEIDPKRKSSFIYYVIPKRSHGKRERYRIKGDTSGSFDVDETTYDSVKDYIDEHEKEDSKKLPFLYYVTPKTFTGFKKRKAPRAESKDLSGDDSFKSATDELPHHDDAMEENPRVITESLTEEMAEAISEIMKDKEGEQPDSDGGEGRKNKGKLQKLFTSSDKKEVKHPVDGSEKDSKLKTGFMGFLSRKQPSLESSVKIDEKEVVEGIGEHGAEEKEPQQDELKEEVGDDSKEGETKEDEKHPIEKSKDDEKKAKSHRIGIFKRFSQPEKEAVKTEEAGKLHKDDSQEIVEEHDKSEHIESGQELDGKDVAEKVTKREKDQEDIQKKKKSHRIGILKRFSFTESETSAKEQPDQERIAEANVEGEKKDKEQKTPEEASEKGGEKDEGSMVTSDEEKSEKTDGKPSSKSHLSVFSIFYKKDKGKESPKDESQKHEPATEGEKGVEKEEAAVKGSEGNGVLEGEEPVEKPEGEIVTSDEERSEKAGVEKKPKSHHLGVFKRFYKKEKEGEESKEESQRGQAVVQEEEQDVVKDGEKGEEKDVEKPESDIVTSDEERSEKAGVEKKPKSHHLGVFKRFYKKESEDSKEESEKGVAVVQEEEQKLDKDDEKGQVIEGEEEVEKPEGEIVTSDEERSEKAGVEKKPKSHHLGVFKRFYKKEKEGEESKEESQRGQAVVQEEEQDVVKDGEKGEEKDVEKPEGDIVNSDEERNERADVEKKSKSHHLGVFKRFYKKESEESKEESHKGVAVVQEEEQKLDKDDEKGQVIEGEEEVEKTEGEIITSDEERSEKAGVEKKPKSHHLGVFKRFYKKESEESKEESEKGVAVVQEEEQKLDKDDEKGQVIEGEEEVEKTEGEIVTSDEERSEKAGVEKKPKSHHLGVFKRFYKKEKEGEESKEESQRGQAVVQEEEQDIVKDDEKGEEKDVEKPEGDIVTSDEERSERASVEKKPKSYHLGVFKRFYRKESEESKEESHKGVAVVQEEEQKLDQDDEKGQVIEGEEEVEKPEGEIVTSDEERSEKAGVEKKPKSHHLGVFKRFYKKEKEGEESKEESQNGQAVVQEEEANLVKDDERGKIIEGEKKAVEKSEGEIVTSDEEKSENVSGEKKSKSHHLGVFKRFYKKDKESGTDKDEPHGEEGVEEKAPIEDVGKPQGEIVESDVEKAEGDVTHAEENVEKVDFRKKPKSHFGILKRFYSKDEQDQTSNEEKAIDNADNLKAEGSEIEKEADQNTQNEMVASDEEKSEQTAIEKKQKSHHLGVLKRFYKKDKDMSRDEADKGEPFTKEEKATPKDDAETGEVMEGDEAEKAEGSLITSDEEKNVKAGAEVKSKSHLGVFKRFYKKDKEHEIPKGESEKVEAVTEEEKEAMVGEEKEENKDALDEGEKKDYEKAKDDSVQSDEETSRKADDEKKAKSSHFDIFKRFYKKESEAVKEELQKDESAIEEGKGTEEKQEKHEEDEKAETEILTSDDEKSEKAGLEKKPKSHRVGVFTRFYKKDKDTDSPKDEPLKEEPFTEEKEVTDEQQDKPVDEIVEGGEKDAKKTEGDIVASDEEKSEKADFERKPKSQPLGIFKIFYKKDSEAAKEVPSTEEEKVSDEKMDKSKESVEKTEGDIVTSDEEKSEKGGVEKKPKSQQLGIFKRFYKKDSEHVKEESGKEEEKVSEEEMNKPKDEVEESGEKTEGDVVTSDEEISEKAGVEKKPKSQQLGIFKRFYKKDSEPTKQEPKKEDHSKEEEKVIEEEMDKPKDEVVESVEKTEGDIVTSDEEISEKAGVEKKPKSQQLGIFKRFYKKDSEPTKQEPIKEDHSKEEEKVIEEEMDKPKDEVVESVEKTEGDIVTSDEEISEKAGVEKKPKSQQLGIFKRFYKKDSEPTKQEPKKEDHSKEEEKVIEEEMDKPKDEVVESVEKTEGDIVTSDEEKSEKAGVEKKPKSQQLGIFKRFYKKDSEPTKQEPKKEDHSKEEEVIEEEMDKPKDEVVESVEKTEGDIVTSDEEKSEKAGVEKKPKSQQLGIFKRFYKKDSEPTKQEPKKEDHSKEEEVIEEEMDKPKDEVVESVEKTEGDIVTSDEEISEKASVEKKHKTHQMGVFKRFYKKERDSEASKDEAQKDKPGTEEEKVIKEDQDEPKGEIAEVGEKTLGDIVTSDEEKSEKAGLENKPKSHHKGVFKRFYKRSMESETSKDDSKKDQLVTEEEKGTEEEQEKLKDDPEKGVDGDEKKAEMDGVTSEEEKSEKAVVEKKQKSSRLGVLKRFYSKDKDSKQIEEPRAVEDKIEDDAKKELEKSEDIKEVGDVDEQKEKEDVQKKSHRMGIFKRFQSKEKEDEVAEDGKANIKDEGHSKTQENSQELVDDEQKDKSDTGEKQIEYDKGEKVTGDEEKLEQIAPIEKKVKSYHIGIFKRFYQKESDDELGKEVMQKAETVQEDKIVQPEKMEISKDEIKGDEKVADEDAIKGMGASDEKSKKSQPFGIFKRFQQKEKEEPEIKPTEEHEKDSEVVENGFESEGAKAISSEICEPEKKEETKDYHEKKPKSYRIGIFKRFYPDESDAVKEEKQEDKTCGDSKEADEEKSKPETLQVEKPGEISDENMKKLKSQRMFILKRLYHSEEGQPDSSDVDAASEGDTSSSKPKKKAVKRRKSDVEKDDEKEEEVPRKRAVFSKLKTTFTRKGLPKEGEEDVSFDPAKRSPSYDLAVHHADVSCLHPPPKRKLFGTSKFKQLFKKKESDKGPSKDEGILIIQDLSARHPSISTFIDETPNSTSPLPHSTCPALSTLSAASEVPQRDSLAPLAHPEPSPSPFINTDSHSTSSSSHNSPTPSASAEQSSKPTTTSKRKLTFALPFGSASTEEDPMKPVERAIEARSQTADYIGSMVRCLHLTKCYIANNQLMSATLWAGTNSGVIYIFTVAIPPTEKRLEVPITVQLGKEIHLKHGAPVINMMILDGASHPFPEPMAIKRGAAPTPNENGPHRVLITSEEQFKVFTLPQLKPYCKFKLTAQEGSRVRKLGVADFVSTADKNSKETCVMIATNQGDISVYSLPDARKQVMAQCIKKEDISGVNSVVFTRNGEALYLNSASEMSRISLSAKHITLPKGTLGSKPVSTLDVEANRDQTPSPNQEKKAASGEVPLKTVVFKKSGDDAKENGDASVLSGDTTIDSIRDHMDDLKLHEKVVNSTNGGETQISSSKTSKEETTVTVVKTTSVLRSQETAAVQVVETNQSEGNHTVNGTEAPNPGSGASDFGDSRL